MKILMLILDGVSDDPNPELHEKTPLSVAEAPALSWLSAYAEKGFVQTVYRGMQPESLSCIAGLLGYPADLLPSLGRADFEATARGVALEKGDLAFRCNIVGLSETGDTISDFTAGAISDVASAEVLKRVRVERAGWELYKGQSYRNLLVIRDAGIDASEIALCPPHMHQGEPIEDILPRARSAASEALVSDLRNFILCSRKQIGASRMLWLWSPSQHVRMQPFEALHGIKGAIVAGLDFMNGLAARTGMRCEKIVGATGYLDTDYSAKAAAARVHFERADFVLVHLNATDEAAHARDARAKVAAIERADRLILAPSVRFLQENHPKNFAVLVCGDHKTSSLTGLHTVEPVPCLIYRDFISPAPTWGAVFCERMQGSVMNSFDLLKKITEPRRLGPLAGGGVVP